MRCIFCKAPSDSSVSVEHIIPASLGNKDHILPPGWVCDDCNNYLSREVEAPFLNSDYGQRVRAEMRILSRRGRSPALRGCHVESRVQIELQYNKYNGHVLAIREEDSDRFVASARGRGRGNLIFPASGNPELSYEMARFVGKVGLEILAARLMGVDQANEELTSKAEIDELRHYVRRGRPGFIWPVWCRRLYPADQEFSDPGADGYQMLHEFDILFLAAEDGTDAGEYYAIVAILGMEYAINLGGPELDGYLGWLARNEGRSFLYWGRNAIEPSGLTHPAGRGLTR